MEKESEAGWQLGCCVCMVQNKVRVFVVQLSLSLSLSPALSLSLSRFSFPSFRTHWQIYTKSGVLSGAVTLYKSPPSLRSHTVTLKMARPNALPLSFSTFPPLSPSSPDSLSPSPALFLASPSLWAPLYFRQKQSLYFPSHCPALPQSETLIAGRRREGEGWE